MVVVATIRADRAAAMPRNVVPRGSLEVAAAGPAPDHVELIRISSTRFRSGWATLNFIKTVLPIRSFR